MDFAHFPSPEIHQWLLLRGITWFTSDPIVALNVFFLGGFFVVGACAHLLFVATVRLEWLAVILAVSAATVPWHFSRFPHTLLADYSPVPIALLLAFLMWKGWWRKAGTRFLLALAAAAYVGTGGVYYTFYACLVMGPVLLWRIASSRAPRMWWRDVVVATAVPLSLGASLAAHHALTRTRSASWAILRDPLESIAYSGVSVSLVIPWPLRHMLFENREGEARYNILGSLAVVVALGMLLGWQPPAPEVRSGPTARESSRSSRRGCF